MKKSPNLLKGYQSTRSEEVFVSDVIYVESDEGVHYLSLVMDAFNRKIMGNKLSNDMKAENVVKALSGALKAHKTTAPLIHHSDRGSQYCSELYQQRLQDNHFQPSMTDGYDCYQNALAERVNGILKQELLIEKYRKFKVNPPEK